MKIKILLLLLVVSATSILAQAPKKMSYQAVIRNTAGILVVNNDVGLKISILKGSVSGTVVFEETHATFSNANGLVSIEIGSGNVISGDFGQISWGNDSYFLKTETDPNGGSNYTILGTNQLLSVPYALYAEKTKNPGKPTIYIEGDITNEEAAAKLAEELGPNTESIYIQNTTVLTTINLDAATKLNNLSVVNNEALESFSCNAISVHDTFQIQSNYNLTTIEFTALTKVDCYAWIGNPVLSTLKMPHLRLINEFININCPLLTEIDLSGLTTTVISTSNGYFPLDIINSSLSVINLPNLIKGNIRFKDNLLLNTVNCPSMTGGSIFFQSNNTLTSINLPNYNNGFVGVSYAPLLQQLNLPNFTNGSLAIGNNASLNSLSFPNLNTIGSIFDLSYNKFSSTQINTILHQFLSIAPASGKFLNLKYQTPAAPPTGQGILDKSTLLSTGNNVVTD